jgi:hypothetical protein
MEIHSHYFYLMWAFSVAPVVILALYGLFQCGIHVTDFLIMLIVGTIPVINTLVIIVFFIFHVCDGFQKNRQKQY